jgi:glutaminyl-tRNA synthetase
MDLKHPVGAHRPLTHSPTPPLPHYHSPLMSLTETPGPTPPHPPRHFIEEIVQADNAARRWGVWSPDEIPPGAGQVPGEPRIHTRFPPEPNGYLHIGHAKSICLNYGLARDYRGRFNLRFDDTNPAKEEQEYVDAIKRDVRWLGADWEGPFGGGLYFASDYFEQMYQFAEELVRKGRAYVCDLTPEQVAEYRGIPQKPGRESPWRNRAPEENLALLREMRDGKHPDGSRTLRARIDMASPNLNLRDPVMYRILHESHHNTGDRWKIYPMYDWAHCIEDALEGITHSLCTLEFEINRPLYHWFLDAINEGTSTLRADNNTLPIHHPQQIEFSKLRPTYTVLSKRNLLKLVQDGVVRGWDDPRMPTLAGMRRLGYTPQSIWALCEDVGVTKYEGYADITRLENALRDHLNRIAPRRMAVLRPLKVTIENYPEGHSEELDAVNNPEDAAAGTRKVPFSRTLYIERDDFMENPPKKFFRLSPGAEVRLRYAYFITCRDVVKDASGEIVELRCTYDPATRGGDSPDGRKVKATLHWVSAQHAIPAEVRLFDRLFNAEIPGKRTGSFLDDLNPYSLEVITGHLEPSLATAQPGERFQFERLGYFCVDPGTEAARPAQPGALVFNRSVTLKDTWAKVAAKGP